jgi:hypothetical protein
MARPDADDNGSEVKLTSTEKQEPAEQHHRDRQLRWETRSSSAPLPISPGKASCKNVRDPPIRISLNPALIVGRTFQIWSFCEP